MDWFIATSIIKSQVLIEVLSDAINTELLVIDSITESDLSAKQKLHKAVATFVKRALNSPQLAYSLMFEPVDSTVEHERFRVKQLIKQSIKKYLRMEMQVVSLSWMI